MQEPIIEIFGKRVKMVQDGEKVKCHMCAFNWECEMIPFDSPFPPPCEKINKNENQHFEEVKDEDIN